MASLTKKQKEFSASLIAVKSAMELAQQNYKMLMAQCKHKYTKRGLNAKCLVCEEFAKTPYCEASPDKCCDYRGYRNYCAHCNDDYDDKCQKEYGIPMSHEL